MLFCRAALPSGRVARGQLGSVRAPETTQANPVGIQALCQATQVHTLTAASVQDMHFVRIARAQADGAQDLCGHCSCLRCETVRFEECALRAYNGFARCHGCWINLGWRQKVYVSLLCNVDGVPIATPQQILLRPGEVVTASAEQIPRICRAIGLFLKIGSVSVSRILMRLSPVAGSQATA